MKSLKFLLLAAFLTSPVFAVEPECFPEEVLPDNAFPSVKLETSMGDIVVELNRRRAPVTASSMASALRKRWSRSLAMARATSSSISGGMASSRSRIRGGGSSR